MRLMEFISSLFHHQTKKADFDLNYLLLSSQRALLDAVIPELRAVTIDFDDNKHEIILHFFYDCEVNDKLFELASCAGTEIEENPEYPFFCTLNEDIAISMPFPQEIPPHGYLIYLRKEPCLPRITKKRKIDLLQTKTPIARLLLVMQEALLGKVTPSLRIVSIDMNPEEKELYLYFEYDSPISNEDRNLANLAVQEARTSFPEYTPYSYIQPVGEHNQKGTRVAYSRWEPSKE